jgi:DNA replication protein DnaC
MKKKWTEYGVPEIYADKPYDIYEDKQKITYYVLDWLNDVLPPDSQKPQMWCLWIFGEPGNGKTHFCTSILKAFIILNRQKSARFLTCKSYFDYLQGSFNDPIESATKKLIIHDTDLLILDDIGTMPYTDWKREALYNLIEDRHDSGKKTIFSSNLSLVETTRAQPGLPPLFDDRLYRRIELGACIPFTRSKDHGRKNYYQRKNLSSEF